MPDTTQHLSRLDQKIISRYVENIGFLQYMGLFLLAIIGFAIAYTHLTPGENGIGRDNVPLPDMTLWKGVYFSVVTITSLGYGDLHPMGFSKFLAGVEIIIGLVFVGIMIAKATSQRLSYHVSRLFISDAQKRLNDISKEFEASRNSLSSIRKRLDHVYLTTPGPNGSSNDDKDTVLSEFKTIVMVLSQNCTVDHDYFSSVAALDDYFHSVPASAVVRAGESIEGAFWEMGQLVIGLSSAAKGEILDQYIRRRISDAISSQKKTCDLVRQFATDEGTRDIFGDIKAACEQISAGYFATPEEQSPDQVFPGTSEPQQPQQPSAT